MAISQVVMSALHVLITFLNIAKLYQKPFQKHLNDITVLRGEREVFYQFERMSKSSKNFWNHIVMYMPGHYDTLILYIV